MARSGARRKATPTTPQTASARCGTVRASARHEFSAVEAEMFFPKLRRQAKWMFVFLALAFGIGFVAFGIGGTGGSGISDLFQRADGGLERPIGRRALGEDRRRQPRRLQGPVRGLPDRRKQDEAIAAGESYVRAHPKDYEFMRTLASDYEGRARHAARRGVGDPGRAQLIDRHHLRDSSLTACSGGRSARGGSTGS